MESPSRPGASGGALEIRASSADGRRAAAHAVEILEGGGTLAGWTDAKAGSVVTITYPSGITRGVGVDERGRFWLGWVAPGIYEISQPGRSPAPVTVTDGAKLDVDLRQD